MIQTINPMKRELMSYDFETAGPIVAIITFIQNERQTFIHENMQRIDDKMKRDAR